MNSTKMESDRKSSKVLLERDIKTSLVANSRIAESISPIYSKRCSWVRRKLGLAKIQKTLSLSSLSRDFNAWSAIK